VLSALLACRELIKREKSEKVGAVSDLDPLLPLWVPIDCASPDLDRITSETARNVAEKYIGVGEFVFDSSMAAAHASQFFKKTSANSNAQIPSPLAKLAEKTQQDSGSGSWWK
jgi:hypothetical protein